MYTRLVGQCGVCIWTPVATLWRAHKHRYSGRQSTTQTAKFPTCRHYNWLTYVVSINEHFQQKICSNNRSVVHVSYIKVKVKASTFWVVSEVTDAQNDE